MQVKVIFKDGSDYVYSDVMKTRHQPEGVELYLSDKTKFIPWNEIEDYNFVRQVA